MITFPSGACIWLVAGVTDICCSFNGLAAKVQNRLRDDMVKILWADADGLFLFTKWLDRGSFVWQVSRDGRVHLTQAQLAMLLEGINWKHPQRINHPALRI